MTKKEHALKRQKALFDLIDQWTGSFFMTDQAIKDKMPEWYEDCNSKTVRRDIDTLTDRFLIHKSYKWSNHKTHIRICTVVNRKKDLRFQSDSNYLEGIVLSNPDCFKVHWRIGYDHYYGGAQKYIDTLNLHRGTTCTGVYLLKEPNKMLSQRPIRYKNITKYDNESIGSNAMDDEPLPF